MELIFSDSARRGMVDLNQDLKSLFIKHLEKMQDVPPRKYMKYGTPCHVEKVTKLARIVYDIKGEQLYVLHCFATHKEYERWYESYK
jgi:phage-related protein